jgi:ketosteroid isomerase-like protein
MTSMPRLVLCLVLLVSCLSPKQLHAQKGLADEVKQAEQKWIAAVTSKDKSALEAILAKELVYTHSTGLVEDKGQYLQALASGNQKYDSIEYEAPAIQTYGSTAVVTTKVVMKGATKGQPFNNQLRLLHVWVKQGGKWSLVAHQTTRLP